MVVQAIAPLGAPVLTAVAVLAALSMTLGNVMALRQDGVVRLLAWSTVAQAGWVILPLAAVSTSAVRASGGYLLAYVVATLLAFAVVAALAQLRGPVAARTLSSYGSDAGCCASTPCWRCALGLALLSLAGLPPGLLGVVAKVVALRPVVADGLWLLAVVAAGNAVLGVAVYLRWLRLLLGPVPGEDVVGEPVGRADRHARGRPPPGPPRGARRGAADFAALVLTSLAPEPAAAPARLSRARGPEHRPTCSAEPRTRTGTPAVAASLIGHAQPPQRPEDRCAVRRHLRRPARPRRRHRPGPLSSGCSP